MSPKSNSASSRSRPMSAASSSPVRSASVATRQCSPSRPSANTPKTVCVFPTSTASSTTSYPLGNSSTKRELPYPPPDVPVGSLGLRRETLGIDVVGAERLPELLRQGLRREGRRVSLPAELLDRHVARRVDVGARDDARRAILVPDPHVFHRQVEERIARVVVRLQIGVVAEVRRVLRDNAVAKEAEDGRVLLLEPELELR